MAMKFNPAPGWPPTPEGWTPPPGWTPDPSWPAAPQGWQFWVDDEAPAPTASQQDGSDAPTAVFPAAQGAPQQGVPQQDPRQLSAPQQGGQQYAQGAPPPVPYAEYPQQGNSQQSYQPGQPGHPGQEPKKKNHLVWIIPVVLIVVLGLIFGGLAIAGVFSSDDDEPEAQTTTPAETPTSEEPTPDPTSEDPIEPAPELSENPEGLEELEGLEDLEGLEELEQLLGTGEKSTDPATPAFCEAYNNIDEGTDASEPTIAEMEASIRDMEKMNPPAEIAAEWSEFTRIMRETVENAAAGGGSLSSEELNSAFFEGEGFAALMKVGSFVGVNCDPML